MAWFCDCLVLKFRGFGLFVIFLIFFNIFFIYSPGVRLCAAVFFLKLSFGSSALLLGVNYHLVLMLAYPLLGSNMGLSTAWILISGFSQLDSLVGLFTAYYVVIHWLVLTLTVLVLGWHVWLFPALLDYSQFC